MRVAEELAAVAPKRHTLLTIGVFDGVHVGHQYLIGQLRKEAEERGFLGGVVTFRQHPQTILSPQSRMSYLTTLEERTELIHSLGIELVAALSFTPELSQLSAREFALLLKDHLKMQGLVIGPDFALGRGREGNATYLKALGQELDFSVDVVRPLKQNAETVSSTAIRDALTRGDVAKVTRFLGRNFTLSGLVVKGVERGRTLGFPTANLAVNSNQALPADGVYATRVYVGVSTHKAVVNIGQRPTFGEKDRTIEVYLLDFKGDLYGEEIKVELVERLRAERKFDGVEELKVQISKDVERARAILDDAIDHGR